MKYFLQAVILVLLLTKTTNAYSSLWINDPQRWYVGQRDD